MKKSVSVIGGLMLAAASGYGMWTYYKKRNPKAALDMEHMMKSISKDVEKEVREMM